jgi:DNA-directed RNA polymerase specialized sigma24 family protein
MQRPHRHERRPSDLDEIARLAKRAADATEALERAVLDAVHQGYSLREIAEHADLAHNSVRRWMQRHFE